MHVKYPRDLLRNFFLPKFGCSIEPFSLVTRENILKKKNSETTRLGRRGAQVRRRDSFA